MHTNDFRNGLCLGLTVLGIGCRSGLPQSGVGDPHKAPVAGLAANHLRAPFDIEARRVHLPSREPARLPSIPNLAAIRDVDGVSFYVDENKSVADPKLKQQNVEALAPLREFVRGVVLHADAWASSQPEFPQYAERVRDALCSWAIGKALLGKVNRQGAYEREWSLGSLALAYLKVRDAEVISPEQRNLVQGWLRELAETVIPNNERAGLRSSSNNHAYWTGMAVAAAGIASDSRALFDWGIARSRLAIEQVRPDGVLPLELDRRALALHYHVFAAAPLVMLAEMGAANGMDLYHEKDSALMRLIDRVIQGLSDPATFAELAGVPQEIAVPPAKTDLAWAEPYFARFGDRRLSGWLAQARPLFDVRLGGDMTATFARFPTLALP